MGTAARRILVTGGTGFSGQHLCTQLMQEGAQVVVLSWNGDKMPAGVELVRGDVRDAEAVRQIFEQVRPDEVYHLAAISSVPVSWTKPRLAFEVNVGGTFNVVEAAMQMDPVPRVLNVSSGQVYADHAASALDEQSLTRPSNPYAASKAMAELLPVLHKNGRHGGGVITVRPFNHTGPGQTPDFALSSFAKQIAEAEAGLRPPRIQVGDLEVERDFTDVRDVVRGYRLLLRFGTPGELYNICSGESYSLKMLLDTLCSLARVELQVEVEAARLRPQQASKIAGTADKLRQATGWKPEISIRQTLQDLLDWWRSRVAAAEDPQSNPA